MKLFVDYIIAQDLIFALATEFTVASGLDKIVWNKVKDFNAFKGIEVNAMDIIRSTHANIKGGSNVIMFYDYYCNIQSPSAQRN